MFRSRNSSYMNKIKNVLWPKKGFQRSFYYLRERVSRMSASTHALSLGIACGAAASMTPFLGLHFIIAALMAYILRGNLFTSAIGTIIGNPWSFPLIWAADNYVGGWIITQFGLEGWIASLTSSAGPDMPMAFFFKVTIGGVVLAILSFPIYYGLSYWGLASWRTHRARRKQARLALKQQQYHQQRQEPLAPNLAMPTQAQTPVRDEPPQNH